MAPATAQLAAVSDTAEPSPELFDELLTELPIWQQFARIGGDLNPALISAILRDADAGYPARLVDLTHELRQRDGHFQSVAETREKAVSELPWALTLPEGSLRRDEKAAQRLTDALKAAEGFVEAIEHLVGEPILFGHGTVEVIWKVDADGWFVPARFKPVSCRRFGFRQSDGALLFDTQGYGNVSNGGADLTQQAPGKFINVRRRINGDVLLREGLSRCLVWLGSFRNWDTKDFLAFAELGWKPWRRAVYKAGAGKEDKANLLAKLTKMASTGVMVHSEQIEIHVEWPKNSVGTGQSGHKELADHLADEMSKAYLGGTLMVQAGNRGARSLGETQDKLRLSRRDGDVLAVCTAFTHGVARPFMQMNRGQKGAPLTFVMQTDEGVDQKAFAEAIETYGKAGLPIPTAYVYDQAGIPAPKDGDKLLEPPKPTTPPAPSKNAKSSKNDQADDPQDDGA